MEKKLLNCLLLLSLTINLFSQKVIKVNTNDYGLNGNVKEVHSNKYFYKNNFGEFTKAHKMHSESLLFNSNGSLTQKRVDSYNAFGKFTDTEITKFFLGRLTEKVEDNNKVKKITKYDEFDNEIEYLEFHADQLVNKKISKYNNKGLLLEKMEYMENGNLLFKKTYAYNDSSKLEKLISYGKYGQVDYILNYYYNKLTRLDSIIKLDRYNIKLQITKLIYNDNNLRISENTYEKNNDIISTVTLVYNLNNQLIKRTSIENGVVNSSKSLTYNQSGSIEKIEEETYNSNGTVDYKYCYEYDLDGNLIYELFESIRFNDKVIKYRKFSGNKIIEKETVNYSGFREGHYKTKEYFENDRLAKLEYFEFDAKGIQTSKSITFFNIKGLPSKKEFVDIDKNKTIDYLKYNEKFELIEKTMAGAKYSYKYIYDFNKNWIECQEIQNDDFPFTITEREISYY